MSEEEKTKQEERAETRKAVVVELRGQPKDVKNKVLAAFDATEEYEGFDIGAEIVKAKAALSGRTKKRSAHRATRDELRKLEVKTDKPTDGAIPTEIPRMDFTDTKLGKLADKNKVADYVLAGAAVENGWDVNSKVSENDFLAGIKNFLEKPHGGHRAKLIRMHRKTYARAVKCGDEEAADKAEAALAEIGEKPAQSRTNGKGA